MLPPDRVYCETLNISHMTVKKAIDLLVSEGILTRKKGVGTFVVSPKIRQELFSLAGFTGDNARHGRKIDSQVLRFGVEKAPAKIAYGSRESNQHLCSALDTPMFNLERISYDTDGRAVEFVESIYRADRYIFSATLIAP